MAINVNSYVGSYFGAGQALISEETRRRLLALGIDPATVTSEIQAKNLIAKIEKSKKIEQTQIEPKQNLPETEPKTEQELEKAVLMRMNYNANINKMILGL